METKNTLTLLSGTVLVTGGTHTVIVPEIVEVEDGSPVLLQNAEGQYLGTAEVTDVRVVTFALLQNKELAQTAHPDTGSFPNALRTIVQQVPDFTQLEKVSVVTFFLHESPDTGLTIAPAVEAAEESDEDVEVPSEEEQYAGLDTIGEVA